MHSPGGMSADRDDGPFNSSGLQLLSEIQGAHNALLACVSLMEAATAHSAPQPVELTRARLKISQASLARRVVWRRIQEFLLCRVRAADSAILRDLTVNDLNYFQRSTAHVSQWTGEAALSDWPAYQAASKAIRGQIMDNVEAERSLLYPMLYRYR